METNTNTNTNTETKPNIPTNIKLKRHRIYDIEAIINTSWELLPGHMQSSTIREQLKTMVTNPEEVTEQEINDCMEQLNLDESKALMGVTVVNFHNKSSTHITCTEVEHNKFIEELDSYLVTLTELRNNSDHWPY